MLVSDQVLFIYLYCFVFNISIDICGLIMFLEIICAAIIERVGNVYSLKGAVKYVRNFALSLGERMCGWRSLWNVWLVKAFSHACAWMWEKKVMMIDTAVFHASSLPSRRYSSGEKKIAVSVISFNNRFGEKVLAGGLITYDSCFVFVLTPGQWRSRRTPSCTAATSTPRSDTGRLVHQTSGLTTSSTPSS